MRTRIFLSILGAFLILGGLGVASAGPEKVVDTDGPGMCDLPGPQCHDVRLPVPLPDLCGPDAAVITLDAAQTKELCRKASRCAVGLVDLGGSGPIRTIEDFVGRCGSVDDRCRTGLTDLGGSGPIRVIDGVVGCDSDVDKCATGLTDLGGSGPIRVIDGVVDCDAEGGGTATLCDVAIAETLADSVIDAAEEQGIAVVCGASCGVLRHGARAIVVCKPSIFD